MGERKKSSRSKQINSFPTGSIASLVWGSILWLFAIFSQIWVSRTITMTVAAAATLLSAAGFIMICRTTVSVLYRYPSRENYSALDPHGDFNNSLGQVEQITCPDYKERLEKSYLN
jgi:hypothetical protein